MEKKDLQPAPAEETAEKPSEPEPAPAAEITEKPSEPELVPVGEIVSAQTPPLDTSDEEEGLEKAMEQALAAQADDEHDDTGTDLAGAFSWRDKARVDARLLIGAGLGLVAVAVIVWALLSGRKPEGKLVINEVMTSNQSTIVDETLGTPDWVELYNGSGSDLNVAGFGLSDSMKNSYRYTLPDIVIPAGGYLIVYFTGGTQAADENPLCAGFGLSRDGDLLVLVDAHYELLCEVDVPALDTDSAYARRADGTYGVTYAPTPNAANNVG